MNSPKPREHALVYRLSRMLGALGTVRADERRDAFGAFLTLLGFMAGHSLLETARDALFLAELPASLLPWVYLTLAASALLLTRYHGNLARYLPRGQELRGWLIFSGVTTLVVWLAIFWAGDWIYYLLYAWTGILATLIVIQFWTMLGNLFTVTQAKRLFAIIGTGSILGAILGSGLARALTAIVPSHHLVLFAGIAFLLTSLGPRLISSAPTPANRGAPDYTAAEFLHVGRVVLSRPYLRRIALTILLATVTFTLVDYIFKSTVARYVSDDQLGAFFASTYLSLNILSLAIQVTTVGWILRHLTVSSALAIVPLLLVTGAFGFVVTGGLVAAWLLKGADGSLRYSLYRTTTELLFVPIPAETRTRVKGMIDVLGQRGGQAIGSLLVLLVLSVTTSEAAIAVFAALAAGGWLWCVIRLRPDYLNLFRQTLREDITPTRIEFPTLDVASLETLLYTLNSPDDRRVIAALDLLADQAKIKVVPGLILYHPSPTVVIRALELFAAAARDDVLPLFDRLAADANPAVRTAALRARAVLEPEQERLRAAMTDESAAVRATAAVAIVARGWGAYAELADDLEQSIAGGDADIELAIADAIRVLPAQEFEPLLLRLAGSHAPAVQLASVRAMRAIGHPTFIEPLIGLLERRPLRSEARAALVALGPRALVRLGLALGDAALPHAVRRHVPHTIAAFGTPQAASTLLQQLQQEADGMIRFKVLRALGRMRTINSALLLDERTIQQAIELNLRAAFRYLRWKQVLRHGADQVPAEWREYLLLLTDLLEDKETHTLQRLFRLLNLQANDEEFLRIYRGLESPRREARAGSRELIQHIVAPTLSRSLLTIVDDLYESSGSRDAAAFAAEGHTVESTLEELATSSIESLSSLAVFVAGRSDFPRLRGSLRRIDPLSPSHAEILADALSRAGLSPGEAAAHG